MERGRQVTQSENEGDETKRNKPVPVPEVLEKFLAGVELPAGE
jgi:hypothetical protein